MEVYIAASRATLLAMANGIIEDFSFQGDPNRVGEFDRVVEAECNGQHVLLHFNNEDMERPEVADVVLVEIEGA